MNYRILRNIPDHSSIQNSLTVRSWPEFMLHDPVANRNWGKLFDYFDDFQFTLMMGDDLAGSCNGLAVFWDKALKDLPETGWDWVVSEGVKQYENGIIPNTAVGIQINVAPEQRGKGLSTTILNEMKRSAREKGLHQLIIPVRPSWKSKYPLISIDDYILWKNQDGFPFDPWIRVHVRAGGRIIKPCYRAMEITGTVGEWENWTELRLPQTGDYIIPGALNPVAVNKNADSGTYIEPNIWIVHSVNS